MAMLVALDLNQNVMAADSDGPIMRIFEFVLAPEAVQPILDEGRKNIETSLRDEPGVLSMYSAVDKDDPTKLYVVEVYRDQAAYQAHVESAHFKAFISAIQSKIISRQVRETSPATLGSKAFSWPSQ